MAQKGGVQQAKRRLGKKETVVQQPGTQLNEVAGGGGETKRVENNGVYPGGPNTGELNRLGGETNQGKQGKRWKGPAGGNQNGKKAFTTPGSK